MARFSSLGALASSLTGRLVVALAAIQLVVLPLVFVGFGRSMHRDYEAQFVDDVRQDAYHLASLLAWEGGDEERLTRLLDDLILDARVVYADAQVGSRIVHPTIEGALGTQRFTEDFSFNEHGDRIYFIATTVPMAGRDVGFELRLGFDENQVSKRVAAAYARFAQIVAAYLGMSLIGVMAIVPLLTRSLRRLGAAARRVASGDLSADLTVKTSVEDVAALAVDLEWMREEVVSRTHEVAAREKETRAIVESAADGIITIGENGVTERANRSAEEIFGYAQGELAGREISELVPDESRGVCQAELENYLSTGQSQVLNASIEVEGLRKDGTKVPIRLAVSEVCIGEKRSFTGIIQDITQQRELEDMKAHFLSAVSHEIRTPLNAIVSAAKVLKKYGNKKPDTVERFAGVITDEGARLTRLINNMLDLAKMEAGKVDWVMGEIQAVSLLERIEFLGGAAAAEKSIALSVQADEDLPPVYADFDKIIQVLTNLINNAVKFTDTGGRIEVRAVRHNERNLRFFVRDSGKGIAEQDQPRVFEKFKQVGEADQGAAKGTGLGLHICKEIVDVHGGKIWVDSQVGEGSTFAFTLVVAGGAEGAAHSEAG